LKQPNSQKLEDKDKLLSSVETKPKVFNNNLDVMSLKNPLEFYSLRMRVRLEQDKFNHKSAAC
jgi:hypothetical protein